LSSFTLRRLPYWKGSSQRHPTALSSLPASPFKLIASSSHRTSSSRTSSSYLWAAPSILLLTQLIPSDDDTDGNKENGYSPNLPSPSTSLLLKESTSDRLFAPPLAPLSIAETRLSVGVSIIPHPAKREKGGEDAYFVSDDLRILGVADGVGGWGDLGVDPALYSRMLMAGAKYIADITPSHRDPQEIMSESFNHASDVQGSSTCCILVLEGNYLKTANLGDSGFMVIRNEKLVFRSKEQQHSFNFPYQLGTGSSDRPAHASCTVLNVQPGDLIIMGTDGLFDNLYDEEIVAIAAMSAEPATIAQLLARRAFMVGNSKSLISPFAKAARGNGYPLALGGKLDDITVMVGRIVLVCDPMAA